MSSIRILRTALLLLLPLLGAASVFAEPMPMRIAVNHGTKECAEFGCGDECADCILPPGWEQHGEECAYPWVEEYRCDTAPAADWRIIGAGLCCLGLVASLSLGGALV